MNTIEVFSIRINPITKQGFLDIISEAIKNKNHIVQSGVNAASIVDIQTNSSLKEAYNNCNLINIDGMSLVWALRFFGYIIPERVACPDLTESLLKLAEVNGYSIFLLGAKEENLILAINNIKLTYPKLCIAGYRNGYFMENEEDSIVQLIETSNTNILLLGLPSPLKEIFVEKYKKRLNVNYVLGVGGFFDILAGSIKRAPKWMQSIGLEWFYRFIQEPNRLLGRYFIGNLKFIKLVIIEKIKKVFY